MIITNAMLVGALGASHRAFIDPAAVKAADKQKAIENCAKSVELNPDNKAARTSCRDCKRCIER